MTRRIVHGVSSMKEETVRDEQITSAVNISTIKYWATRNLSSVSHLRAVLLLELDVLTVDQFLTKMDTWLKLAELEDSETNRRAHYG